MEIYVAAAGAPAGVKTPPPEQKLALRVALRPRKGMSLLPGTEITIGASDAIRFFHGDRSIALARGETVRLPLGELGRLALDIPAVDFITPALTLRTDDMPPDQLAVVHPDEPLHCYLAGLRARDVEGLLSEDMVKGRARLRADGAAQRPPRPRQPARAHGLFVVHAARHPDGRVHGAADRGASRRRLRDRVPAKGSRR